VEADYTWKILSVVSMFNIVTNFFISCDLVKEILYSNTEIVYNKTQLDCKLFPKETSIYRIIDSRPKFD
jgi:hypothetical protein